MEDRTHSSPQHIPMYNKEKEEKMNEKKKNGGERKLYKDILLYVSTLLVRCSVVLVCLFEGKRKFMREHCFAYWIIPSPSKRQTRVGMSVRVAQNYTATKNN